MYCVNVYTNGNYEMFISLTAVDKPTKMRPHPVNKSATRMASLHPDKNPAPAEKMSSSASSDGAKDKVPAVKCNILLKNYVAEKVT